MTHKPMLALLTLAVVAPFAVAQATPPQPELGAANWVPADSTRFYSAQRLGEQWALLRDSNAMKEVLALPLAKMAWTAALAAEPWRRLEALRDDMPVVETAVEVLGDALSQEVFVCLDARWTLFEGLIALGYIDMIATAAQEAGRTSPDGEAAVRRQMVRYLTLLELPGTLVGCRLRDPARARQLIDQLCAQLADSSVPPIVEQTIGEDAFRVLHLDAGMVPAPARAQWRREFLASGATDEQVARVDTWFDAVKLAIAIGVRDDYLLLSIAPDTAQLQALGGEHNLAASPAFAPVRRVCKPGVVAIDYSTPDLSARQPLAVDVLGERLEAMLASVDARLPPGLAARLAPDVRELLTDLNTGYGEPQAEVAISFLDRGIETYAFQAALQGDLDASKPLSIAEHAGAAPLLLLANRGAPMRPAFDRLVHWLRKGWSYFEDFQVPRMDERDRAEFDKFAAMCLPFAERLHAVTRDELLPSLDGCQSLLVLDRDGLLPLAPGLPVHLEHPLRVPRAAIVHELNDAAAFTSACTHYRDAVNDLLASVAMDAAPAERIEWPAPTAQPIAAGTRYSYALPPPVAELGLSPCAVVAQDRLVLAMHAEQVPALLASTPVPDDVVDLRGNAGSLLRVDLPGLFELVLDDIDLVVDALRAAEQIDARTHQLVRSHLPGLRRAGRALHSYSSRTWVEGATEVTHSWLQIEDIGR